MTTLEWIVAGIAAYLVIAFLFIRWLHRNVHRDGFECGDV